MTIRKNEKGLMIDCHAMALAYEEMGDLNLSISKEMDHLEWEVMKVIQDFLKNECTSKLISTYT